MSKFLKIFAPAAGGAAGVLTMAYVLADQFVVDIPSIAPVLVSQANAASTDAASDSTTDETQPPATETPEGGFGLGREALPEEIAAWNVDVRPGGIGLPEGRHVALVEPTIRGEVAQEGVHATARALAQQGREHVRIDVGPGRDDGMTAAIEVASVKSAERTPSTRHVHNASSGNAARSAGHASVARPDRTPSDAAPRRRFDGSSAVARSTLARRFL